ncbi:hypothetical protein FBU30_003651, partial [Linnemannia zychae]
DHASLVLTVENNSDITLQTIRLALVRQISFSASANVSSRFAGNISTNPYSTQIFPSATISSTVHTATIPVAKVSNQNSTWTQQLQFKIPSHLNLIPTINKSITPLFDVEYFIVLSLPVPQRQGSFVEDRPSFVRDRFEEEMIRELSSLESLVMDGDSDDNDDLDDDISVEKKSLDDTDDETEDEEPDEAENDPRFMSRIPTRFRKPIQNNSLLAKAAENFQVDN